MRPLELEGERAEVHYDMAASDAPTAKLQKIVYIGIAVAVVILLLFSSSHVDGDGAQEVHQEHCFAVPSTVGWWHRAAVRDTRADKRRLRIVALNAEYLMYDPSVGCKKSWNGCSWKNAAAALTHLHNVAIALQKLDADIISLAEVTLLTDTLLNCMHMHAFGGLSTRSHLLQSCQCCTH
jgi:hypothetical protein